MVSHDELLRIARRYDTVMSLAMLRALGHVGGPRGHARGDGRGTCRRAAAERAKYSGVAQCFRNRISPLDWRRRR